MGAIIPPDLTNIDYITLKKELESRKQTRLTELLHLIAQAEVNLEELRKEEAELQGKPAPKIKIKNLSKVGKQINSTGKKTGKRKKGGPTAKEAILAVLKKGPTPSKEIVKATGLKSGSVSQALNLLKTEKTIKHDGKKGGLWSLK